MKTEIWQAIAGCFAVISVFLILGIVFYVGEPPPKETKQIDQNYFDNRFDRVETGILSTSQDKCGLLGGVFPIDVNGMPSITSFDYLIDENTNTFTRVPMWPCLFFPQAEN